jgi:hypothetical protein
VQLERMVLLDQAVVQELGDMVEPAAVEVSD